MRQLFRTTAILEGVSYLALFAFTMPLKYWAGIGMPNKWVGYAHGSLFIAYLLLLAMVAFMNKWNFKRIALLVVAAFLPFGTFYADKKGYF